MKRTLDMPDGRKLTIEDVEIVERKGETAAEYKLSDGSIVRIMYPVFLIARVEDQYDQFGNPMYFIQNQVVPMTVHSEDMYRKPKDGEKGN